MYFEVVPYTMLESGNRYSCPVCNKDISPGEKYNFIDPFNNNNYAIYVKGSYTCSSEICINMRIFQLMEL